MDVEVTPSWLHLSPNPGYFEITFSCQGFSMATSPLHLALHSNGYVLAAS